MITKRQYLTSLNKKLINQLNRMNAKEYNYVDKVDP